MNPDEIQLESISKLFEYEKHTRVIDTLNEEELRNFSKIEKTTMLVGQGSHFELWSEEAWSHQIQNISIDNQDELPAELDGFSL